jgi:signal transduction histidine kinase
LFHPFEALLARLQRLAEKHYGLLLENNSRNYNLRESEARRLELFSTAAHELRKPLTIIRGIIFSKKNLNSQRKKIDVEITRAGKVLDNILALAQLEVQKTSQAEKIALSQICQNLIGQYKSLHPEFKWRASLSSGVTLWAAQENIFSLLENLLDNAVRHAQAGQEIHFDLKVRLGWVLLSVCDHGIGIGPEEQAKIFEPFYRGKNQRGKRGNGLGLSIVRQAAKNLGAKIEVSSAKGKGSEFRVWIPLNNKQINLDKRQTTDDEQLVSGQFANKQLAITCF